MQIAPGVDVRQWHDLSLDDPDSPDWTGAISIFEGRIRRRFIDPIDYLVNAESGKPPTQRCFGFAVLALDCMLVETLGAFLKGLEDTDGQSKSVFCEVLSTRPQFCGGFNEVLATRFYKDFRCGILHQAETYGDSRVWSVGELIQTDGDEITINRNEFHKRLKAEFQGYLDELRDPRNTELRKNFRTKMDFISR